MRLPDNPSYSTHSLYSNSGASCTDSAHSPRPGAGDGTSRELHEPLTNTKACDLNAEKHLAGAALNPRNPTAELVNVNQPEHLDILKKPDTVNKFVLTENGKMVIGNISKDVPPKWLSHPAIAEIGAGPGQSNNVVSAGYIKKDFTGQVRLSNTSGHYLPKQADLRPAQQYLSSMGVESTKGNCTIV